jgi:NAD/NADP transhydrogenase beta subunit
MEGPVRFAVLAAAIVFITAMAWLTALDFSNNGVTFVGVIGVAVLVVCGVGVLGAFFQPPRK